MRIGRLQVALGVGLSVVFLWFAFRHVGFAGLAANLRGADYRWLLWYPALATTLNLVRSEIWRLLLEKRVGRAEAFWAYGAGFLVNNVLPLRMGEAARIALLAGRRRLPVVEVAAAAGLERMLDLVFVVAILAVSLPFAAGALEMRQALVVVSTSAVLGVGAVALVVAFGDRLTPILSTVVAALIPRYAPPLVRRWRELTNGLSVMRRPAIACRAAAGSMSVWAITIVLQWTVLRAFQPAAGFLEAALLVGAVSIAAAVPAAPGAIGTYQWVAQQALAIPFSALYTTTSALGIALVSHAASYVFGSALGTIGLWYFGVSLASFTRVDAAGRELETIEPALGPSSVAD